MGQSTERELGKRGSRQVSGRRKHKERQRQGHFHILCMDRTSSKKGNPRGVDGRMGESKRQERRTLPSGPHHTKARNSSPRRPKKATHHKSTLYKTRKRQTVPPEYMKNNGRNRRMWVRQPKHGSCPPRMRPELGNKGKRQNRDHKNTPLHQQRNPKSAREMSRVRGRQKREINLSKHERIWLSRAGPIGIISDPLRRPQCSRSIALCGPKYWCN